LECQQTVVCNYTTVCVAWNVPRTLIQYLTCDGPLDEELAKLKLRFFPMLIYAATLFLGDGLCINSACEGRPWVTVYLLVRLLSFSFWVV
jgi:hypothetical protein